MAIDNTLPTKISILFIALMLLNILDIILTLLLILSGAEEINPLMNTALSTSIECFVIAKLGLIVLALSILAAAYKRHQKLVTRVLQASVYLYSTVIAYSSVLYLIGG
jgi:hypothetical protein